MGPCTTVASLAETVRDARAPLTRQHRVLVEMLRLMPLYSEINRLDAWEDACQALILEDEYDLGLEVGNLLRMIFELGQYNLYGNFKAADTLEEFSHLCRQLQRAGIKVPPVPEQALSDW